MATVAPTMDPTDVAATGTAAKVPQMKSEKKRKEEKWKKEYEAWLPEGDDEADFYVEKGGERVYPFYLINTLEVNSINAHDADIEIYMKIYWRFNDLEGAIGRDQIEFYSPDGGGDGTEPEYLTEEMLDTGIPNGTLVRGALPRRKHGKRGDAKPAEKQAQLFHAELPFNVKHPFDNQYGQVEHITPCWSAYDKDKQVLSCQVHLSLHIKVPNPDLASYPIDRRIIPIVVSRRKDKKFERSNGMKAGCSTKLLTMRPNWVEFCYGEDNSVLSVKWPDSASSRKLPLDLRSHQTKLEFTEVKDEDGKTVKVNGEKKMRPTGRKEDQGVFAYRGKHLLVLLERDPRNFLWNVVLPNWILVFASHATMFMEFYIETGDQGNNNKSLLGEQIGVGLGVILAVMANKFVALQQELPSGLPFNTVADYYFVLSFFWVSVLMSINTALWCCATRWNWMATFPILDVDGNPTGAFHNDPNIDEISSFVGIFLGACWIIVNAFFANQALKGGWFKCTKRTPWKIVVERTTEEDVDSYTEFEDPDFVNDKGLLEPRKVNNLDRKKVKSA